MTVESVGLPPALTFKSSRSASVQPPSVRETDAHRNLSTSIYIYRERDGESHGRGQGSFRLHM